MDDKHGVKVFSDDRGKEVGLETETWSVSCCVFKHNGTLICAKTE